MSPRHECRTRGLFRNVLMDTIRRLEWKSVFDTVHGYLFRYHKAGNDRVRPSAGSDNADIHAENSRAVVSTVYGNTVKWNQLVQNGDFNTTDGWINGLSANPNLSTLSVQDNIMTVTKASVAGGSYGGVAMCSNLTVNTSHRYYIHGNIKTSNGAHNAFLQFVQNDGNTGSNTPIASNSVTFVTIKKIVSPSKNTDVFILRSGVSSSPVGTSMSAKNVYLIDLTQIFGSDAEIAAALGISTSNITTDIGAAAFENWLALNVGKQDYYPYDAGSLISFGGTSLKSVGFNQWDEQWEYGAYDSETGEKKDMTQTAVRCKNKIKVIPSIIYYFAFLDDIQMANVRVGFYTKSGYFSITAIKNTTYQIPSDCNYIVFHYAPNSGERVPYDGGICINISDPSKNGIYKPYWENVLPIDPTKVYGKVNGAGEYVQCFPNGLNAVSKNSSGVDVDLKDTLSADTAVRRLGYKALKDVEVSLVTGATRFSLGDDRRYGSIAYFNAMLVSPRYTLALRGSSSGNQKDLTVQLNNSNTAIGYSYVKDSSEDFNIIRAALDQSYIVYELSDYITYTDLMYSEDGGVTGTPLSEFKYKVDKYSTEELIVPTSQTGAPTSTALNADIDYQYRG